MGKNNVIRETFCPFARDRRCNNGCEFFNEDTDHCMIWEIRNEIFKEQAIMAKKKRPESLRRIMGITLKPSFLSMLVKKGKVEIKKSPIPRDATLVSAAFDVYRNCFVIYFEHPSFKLINEGDLVSFFDPTDFELIRHYE